MFLDPVWPCSYGLGTRLGLAGTTDCPGSITSQHILPDLICCSSLFSCVRLVPPRPRSSSTCSFCYRVRVQNVLHVNIMLHVADSQYPYDMWMCMFMLYCMCHSWHGWTNTSSTTSVGSLPQLLGAKTCMIKLSCMIITMKVFHKGLPYYTDIHSSDLLYLYMNNLRQIHVFLTCWTRTPLSVHKSKLTDIVQSVQAIACCQTCLRSQNTPETASSTLRPVLLKSFVYLHTNCDHNTPDPCYQVQMLKISIEKCWP